MPTRLPWQAVHWLTGSGRLFEDVPLDEALLGGFGPAHMTAAAARVAGGAVVLPRLVDSLPLVHVRPALEHLGEGGKGGVQGILGRGRDLAVVGRFRVLALAA